MGLIGGCKSMGGMIGKGIARYAEREAKRQHEAFKEREYYRGLSDKEKETYLLYRKMDDALAGWLKTDYNSDNKY